MKNKDVKALAKCEWYIRSYVNDTSDRVTDFGLAKIEEYLRSTSSFILFDFSGVPCSVKKATADDIVAAGHGDKGVPGSALLNKDGRVIGFVSMWVKEGGGFSAEFSNDYQSL